MRVPTLSLCLIARDEERFLAGCLESARGCVDEVVLVDTGSRDATREIAQSFGARLVERPCDDDFAAARNAGLSVARGTHILVLDADERLVHGAGAALRESLEDTSLLLGLLPLHNADGFDAPFEDVVAGRRRIGAQCLVPRLFPNHPELRYTRRIHETLVRGFTALRRAGRGDAKLIQAPIVHFGEMPSVRRSEGRDRRNELLLRAALSDDPSDGDLAGYLVADLLKSGRHAEARVIGEAVLPRFLRAIDVRPAGDPPASTVRLGYALSFAQADTGAPLAALQTALECAARFPSEHPNLVFAAGYACEKLGQYTAAAEAYSRCLALDGVPTSQHVLTGVTGDLARQRLAIVRRALEVLRSDDGGAPAPQSERLATE